MANRLIDETSPYLLQHAENPVDWYPWCDEAFARAKEEDKPIFLSIGYSTCHWCHVMASENFESKEIADIMNRYFICIKVDKEERPDIDSIYMEVCQLFTGSGGWPTSIFMTADRTPFLAGTYFPKHSRYGMIGFKELLLAVQEKWKYDRTLLIKQSKEAVRNLFPKEIAGNATPDILETSVSMYTKLYDEKHGGFGTAPKFPAAHNIIFLLSYYKKYGNETCLEMSKKTLLQMYRGGLFDHIGFGFCRYSTDRYFLVPHFEKMLYDNALLITAYCKAYLCGPKNELFLNIAKKTADYILREMTSESGGFYSAQDADSDGEEGKYYLFTPQEIISLLGDSVGREFNIQFDITDSGNFDGKNIPNLLKSDYSNTKYEQYFPKINVYKKERAHLNTDDKILTAWNSLMISAMCELYSVTADEKYLSAAVNADLFIQNKLYENAALYVSYRNGKRGVKGFLNDYSTYIYAQLSLYKVTLENKYLQKAKEMCEAVITHFSDSENGGYFLYSDDSEKLICRQKELYDGAMPSGNSLLAYVFVKLWNITSDDRYKTLAQNQLDFMAFTAWQHPTGFAMYLTALTEFYAPDAKITVVAANGFDTNIIPLSLRRQSDIVIIPPNEEYKLTGGKATYYLCRKHCCFPPTNSIDKLLV